MCSLRSIMVNALTWLVYLGFIGGNFTPVGQYLSIKSLFWLISKILRGEEWISEKIRCLVFVENVLVSNFHWTKFGEFFCSDKGAIPEVRSLFLPWSKCLCILHMFIRQCSCFPWYNRFSWTCFLSKSTKN